MRMHKSPPAVGSVDINQKGKYLLNSQTVNDLQTRSSYWFDGVDDNILITTTASNLRLLSAAANPFSVGVWVKVNIPLADGQGIYHIISDEDYQNNGWVLRVRGDSGAEGKIEFRMSSGVSGNEDNTYTAPAGSYPDDQEWHHLLAVRPENGGLNAQQKTT